MPNGDKQEREKARYAAEKGKIKGKRDFDLQAELGYEGIEEGLLISVVIAIEAIIALLLAPEPAISKITAVIASIVVGIFTVIAVVYILVTSKNAIKRIWEEYQAAEKTEDDRHRQAMEGN